MAIPLERTDDLSKALQTIRAAARDRSPVTGLTHQHYKYPARFSPTFARAAIESFSNFGDLVLDPYMGGGTTVVEAIASGRRAVGCDINSLAVFVAKAKTTRLTDQARHEVESWALDALRFSYRDDLSSLTDAFCENRTRNLGSPRSRPLKKVIGAAIATSDCLKSAEASLFARCVLLNVAQWALNGRKRTPTVQEFRRQLLDRALEMLDANGSFHPPSLEVLDGADAPVLVHESAERIATVEPFKSGARADLVVTSPPYPGIHILYHRWQVDGRKETPAPYWIANCLDGSGASYYTFGDRQFRNNDTYFAASLRSLEAVRAVMRDDGTFVQMIAFADAKKQLPRYLANMEKAGFRELRIDSRMHSRIWRKVPRRSWHADYHGHVGGTREVVLIHKCS